MTGDSARVSMTAVYGVSHFVIDLACIATILGAVSRALGIEGAEGVVAAIVAYDLLAFCLQLPFGALVDLADRNARAAMVACGLVAAGTFVSAAPHAPAALAAVALVAVGNALFHCAGGLDVLNVAQGKATLPGAFVSTGTAGGVLADRRGLAAASIASLAGSAALFPFAAAFPAIGMLAAFLFNFTMPVTLISLANLMPASKGITFGIASFSLAIGALPALIGFDVDGPMALSVLAIASLACLLPALRLARGIQDEPDTQAKIARTEGRA